MAKSGKLEPGVFPYLRTEGSSKARQGKGPEPEGPGPYRNVLGDRC